MTISSQTRKTAIFNGNSVTTAFPFTFKVFEAADLLVVQADANGVETVLTLTTDYTVSLNSNQNSNPGGTVTLVTALPTGETMVITSELDLLQSVDLTNQGGFYPRVINDALDRLTIISQQLQEQVDRSAKLPITSSDDPATLTDALVALTAIESDIVAVAAIDTEVAAVAAIDTDVTTVAGIAANVTAVAAIDADVSTAAANIAAIVAAPTEAANAAASADAADASSNASLWSAGPVTAGAVRYSPTDFRSYRARSSFTSSTDPNLDPSNWTLLGDQRRQYVARTSNTQITEADSGTFFDITSGTFSQTFAAAASLGAHFRCIIRNSGTGDITLDPNGAETIDGLANFIMYPGEVRLIQCNGSALFSVVLSAFSRTFTASGTFTKPPGYTRFGGLLWGAGGSGGKGNSANPGSGSGGGGGACVPFTLAASAFGTTETVTIGDGGTAVSAADTAGNAGGNSTIGSVITAYGGGGGGAATAASSSGGGGGGVMGAGADGGSGGAGGSPVTSGATNTGFGGGSAGLGATYGGGGGGSSRTDGAAATPGNSYYGGGGGGGHNTSAAASGGTSVFGGAGGAGGLASAGTAGTAPAGGGGGTRTGATSGAGARGELRIWGVV